MLLLASLLSLVVAVCPAQKKKDTKDTKDASPQLTAELLGGLTFRSIGPALTSGRILDFAVDPARRSRYFVAVACGGVWKTENAGTTYEPVFDGQKSFSIGCVALDPSNTNVVWVGTGENNSQRSVSYGDGVYKSLDGGKSWKRMGLAASEHIAKIVIDPRAPNTVYVACQGPLWAPGGDRGLYKTTDGGATWKAVLTVSENTGVTDLLMDPRDSNLLYAASYQRRRHVWTLINGGPESNIFRSTNGGESWDTLRTGLPSVDKGRIGLAISPVNPDILYATIEAAEKQGGFFRSINRGITWEKRNDFVSDAAQYYQELVCDPKDADRVYILHTILMVTDDGGATLRPLGNRNRHVDDHAMWIDPADPSYYLVGGDGGIYESHDRGATWRFRENLPVTQFYRVSADNAAPFYNVYGGTQDNYSLGGPSRTTCADGILSENWIYTNGGDGFKSQVDPTDPNTVYAQSQYGGLVRFDRASGESSYIQPLPGPGEQPYRWNWDSPLIISPHSVTRLYFASNILLRSDDRGASWRAVSGDLTRQIDRNTLPVMGKVWGVDAVAKNASTSLYGNIVALAESPLREGLLCAGTDDGLLQISENGGAAWRAIDAFPGVPDRSYVSHVIASRHDENVLYAAFDNHKMADFHPYLLRSGDRGTTWTSIAGNLPENGAVYVLAEDPVAPQLLFAGTEFGLFVTVDGGATWLPMKEGLPPMAVRDIAVQERECDLVLASFGRGIFILDDYSALRALNAEAVTRQAIMFPTRDALSYVQTDARARQVQGETFFSAPNPPYGATFTYYIREGAKTMKEQRKEREKEAEKKKEAPPYPTFGDLRAEQQEQAAQLLFTVRDADSAVVRVLSSPLKKGVQRITWDLRHTDPSPVRDPNAPNRRSGMPVMPGRYSVSLASSVGGVVTELVPPQPFTVKPLREGAVSPADREARNTFARAVARLQRAVYGAERAAAELKTRLGYLSGAVDATPALDATPAASAGLRAERRRLELRVDSLLRVLDGDPIVSERNGNQAPSITDRLGTILYSLSGNNFPPSGSQRQGYDILCVGFPPVLDELRAITAAVQAMETRLEQLGAPWTPGRIPEWKRD